MRTVKEVAVLTGISVRTLHYYDEIGLLKPSGFSEAGYRLYDDKALEKLQQILFLREFDLSLKKIKIIIENPDFDRREILKKQKKILELKKKRIERLISSINDILNGGNNMDFKIFDRTEIEEVFDEIIYNMSDEQLKLLSEGFEDIEDYKEKYIENMSGRSVQKQTAKIMEWYGNKEPVIEFISCPAKSRISRAYANRLEDIFERLREQKEQRIEVTDYAVRSLIGELGFVMEQFTQSGEERAVLMVLAEMYQQKDSAEKLDMQYGSGMAEYIVKAIKSFNGDE
ncbi:MAG: MerR family transcriptional regulator [Firmicutes bacterium]|nr:MerR family transcriptional regulator [Bacillota bacterium]